MAEKQESSTSKILSLLDLFTHDKPIWSIDDLISSQGVAQATLYRYIKELCDVGLLAPLGNATYILGPRFIEVDRQLRLNDPILKIAPSIMKEKSEAIKGAQLICRYYGEKVLTIDQYCTDDRLYPLMSMERGRPFSIFYGAPSKIILANLSMRQLQKIYLHEPQEVSKAGLGNSWIEFKALMKKIKNQGYIIASDIDADLVGIAAPIFNKQGNIIASICAVRIKAEVKEEDLNFLKQTMVGVATQISDQL